MIKNAEQERLEQQAALQQRFEHMQRTVSASESRLCDTLKERVIYEARLEAALKQVAYLTEHTEELKSTMEATRADAKALRKDLSDINDENRRLQTKSLAEQQLYNTLMAKYASRQSQAVFFSSKLNKIFVGYFDPDSF